MHQISIYMFIYIYDRLYLVFKAVILSAPLIKTQLLTVELQPNDG